MADALKDTLPALRQALSENQICADTRPALLHLHDLLTQHGAAIAHLLEAAEAAAAAQACSNIEERQAHDQRMAASVMHALTATGACERLRKIGEAAALDAVGADGLLDIKTSSPAAERGALAALVAQLQALPLGVLHTAGGQRAMAAVRTLSLTPPTTSCDDEATPPRYTPPELTDELAAEIGRNVARLQLHGNSWSGGRMSKQRAVRQALWDAGFCSNDAQNYEAFRRRLYRAGNKNPHDAALIAYEIEFPTYKTKNINS